MARWNILPWQTQYRIKFYSDYDITVNVCTWENKISENFLHNDPIKKFYIQNLNRPLFLKNKSLLYGS